MSKFAHSLKNFEPIARQPSNSDLTWLWKAVAPLLLQILYDETGMVHNLIGLIWPEGAYVPRYGEAFADPQELGLMINRSTTTLRPSSVRAMRRRTKRSALTLQRTRKRDGRRHNSYLLSALIPGSKISETRKQFTLRSPWRTSSHTSKQGEQGRNALDLLSLHN